MQIRIPLELKNQLCNREGNLNSHMDSIEVTTFSDIKSSFIPGRIYNELELEIYDHDSIDACRDWFGYGVQLNIGPYIGIIPTGFILDMYSAKVTFSIHEIDLKGGNWKDWFVQGDTLYEEM